MSERFFLISLDSRSKVDPEALERKFDKALDWVRYLPNNWIIRTKLDAQTWYERLQPLLIAKDRKDHLFICKLDLSERQGMLPKWVWEWIQKYEP